MNKAYFAMGLHFHQPVGNFEKILERSFRNCYNPFLEVFSKYPHIKMTFHFSGNLLDYFEERHPEFSDRVRGMVDRGQVEIMGGGYYEPIFQVIPQRDRIRQIEMLADYSERRFGKRPKGMWIPERVWSPGLVGDFSKCGMTYSILDDTHLIKAGISKDNMYGYFMTGGKYGKLAIFPSDRTLRYMIPFKSPRETIDYLKRLAKKRPKGVPSPSTSLGINSVEGKGLLVTYGDDGEKFGEWPWTYDWVYKKGWLDSFLKELKENRDWINIVTFSEYLESHSPITDVYIPESSYEEMLEWSGGSWMNFLSKYPESNQMHKRMLHVSERIFELENKILSTENRERLEEAKRELYKGQTNCPYWHGVFGGIYLYHLRKAVFEHLINADRISDEIEYKDKNNWINVREIDFYGQGREAMIIENKDFFICLDPANGGIIRELDYKARSINLVNALARRKEPYHKKILERINDSLTEPVSIHEAIKTMDVRIKAGIFYDNFTRSCLIDHFIDADLKREDFENCNYIDKGDFADAPYNARIEKEKVVLSRQGKVGEKGISITKEIRISSDAEIEILYILKNESDITIDSSFGMEFNITLPDGSSDRYRYELIRGKASGLNKSGSILRSNSFLIRDSQDELGVRFIFSVCPDKIWYFSVNTISQSERAYDFSYQSTCIFPIWSIKLDNRGEIRLGITWIMK